MDRPLKETVYSPDSELLSFGRLMRSMWSDLLASRELAWRLAIRDLSAQYRQAFFGFAWALILPLANTAAWIFLSSSGVVAVGETEVSYPVYVFAGSMLWAVFMDAVNAPLQGVTASKSMLAKINFPREAIIVSGVYQTLFNAGIKISLLLMSLLLVDMRFGWSLLLFPIGVLSLIMIGTALGLLLTPVGVLYTDIAKGLPLLMQFLMYLTPVVFAMPKEGLASKVFILNPLTPVILTIRDWLVGTTPEFLGYFVVVNIAALLLLAVVWVVYRLAMPILIERMSA